MAILTAGGDRPSDSVLLVALEALSDGQVVGIPTDTVYGLAVDPFVPGASDRVFAAKRRPRDVELPVLVAGPEQALQLATAVPEGARRLMDAYWPGPLTLVLPRRPGLQADLGSDEATIGVRCPAHPVPLALCAKAGPLATTSANRHGEPTCHTAADVEAVFGHEVAIILDCGALSGAPSTVVDFTGHVPKLLRQGRVAWQEILDVAVGQR